MGYAALRPQTNRLTRGFAFGLGIPWLFIYFVNTIWKTDAETPFRWEGTAEMGPVTLLLIILGICWLWFGADYDEFDTSRHRH
jgi:hypothetical protein